MFIPNPYCVHGIVYLVISCEASKYRCRTLMRDAAEVVTILALSWSLERRKLKAILNGNDYCGGMHGELWQIWDTIAGVRGQ